MNNQSALSELFDLSRAELETERKIKNGFETRAGLIIAFVGAISVLWFGQLKFELSLTFDTIVSVLFVLCLLWTVSVLLSIIGVRSYKRVAIEQILTKSFVCSNDKEATLLYLIEHYNRIIINYRTTNAKISNRLNMSVIFVGILFAIGLILYAYPHTI